MSRETQYIGLNKFGKEFIDKYASEKVIIPSEGADVVLGMFGEEVHVCKRFIYLIREEFLRSIFKLILGLVGLCFLLRLDGRILKSLFKKVYG